MQEIAGICIGTRHGGDYLQLQWIKYAGIVNGQRRPRQSRCANQQDNERERQSIHRGEYFRVAYFAETNFARSSLNFTIDGSWMYIMIDRILFIIIPRIVEA